MREVDITMDHIIVVLMNVLLFPMWEHYFSLFSFISFIILRLNVLLLMSRAALPNVIIIWRDTNASRYGSPSIDWDTVILFRCQSLIVLIVLDARERVPNVPPPILYWMEYGSYLFNRLVVDRRNGNLSLKDSVCRGRIVSEWNVYLLLWDIGKEELHVRERYHFIPDSLVSTVVLSNGSMNNPL